MNDFTFGEKLFRYRKVAGLTQSALAEKLNVTDKAVSKWENGAAKPTTDILRKLAAIFGITVEELLQLREKEPKKRITKIVLTGGPCAGKTTAQSWIQNNMPKYGYRVLFVPETATELIGGGADPKLFNSNLDYQRCQMRLQLEKEKVFEQAAQAMPAEKVLIVCDRGTIDNKAYMTDLDFLRLCEELGTSEVELRDRYDAVFHLVTAAKGASKAYTTANNEARKETAEEASELDDKLIAAWTGHPHLRVIDNSTSFEDKLKRLMREIITALGEPEPLEIERKFLIHYPDLKWLEEQKNCRKVDIIQTYLQSNSEEEIRVRQRGQRGHYVYFQTIKRAVSETTRVEIEQRLTKEEYLRLLMNADTTRRQIRKTRYCLMYQNQYFEIDIFPFWKDQAICEIELADEQAQIALPPEMKVIREVTNDPAYRNAALAQI
ncbi:MAG: AAA family ATPase [Clostridia bacterium]|nr:AAA family ATPase [Clostridia bacterium]